MPPYVKPNYLRHGFPVTSFGYALYCDAMFSRESYLAWVNSNKTDHSYLDDYLLDPTVGFPALARHTIHFDVAKAGTPSMVGQEKRFLPTRQQAALVLVFSMLEMTGKASELPTAVNPPQYNRKDAVVSPERPLISCMALIFLNQDPSFRSDPAAFLAQFALQDVTKALLTTFANSGRPFLTEAEAQALTPALIEEYVAAPPIW